MSDAGQKSVKFREAVFFAPALDRRKTHARRTLERCWKHRQEIWNPRWKRVESARYRGRSALDARHLRMIRGRYTKRYEAQRRRGTTPPPDAREGLMRGKNTIKCVVLHCPPWRALRQRCACRKRCDGLSLTPCCLLALIKGILACPVAGLDDNWSWPDPSATRTEAKPPKRFESRGELAAPCGSPLLYDRAAQKQARTQPSRSSARRFIPGSRAPVPCLISTRCG